MNKIKSNVTQKLKGTTEYHTDEKIILRDFLALERTKLANERTYLSYVKFSLYLIVAAIALIKVEGFESLAYLAYISFVVSGISFILGTTRFFYLRKQLKSFYKDDVQKMHKNY